MVIISIYFRTWALTSNINKFIDFSTKFTYNHFILLDSVTKVTVCREVTCP